MKCQDTRQQHNNDCRGLGTITCKERILSDVQCHFVGFYNVKVRPGYDIHEVRTCEMEETRTTVPISSATHEQQNDMAMLFAAIKGKLGSSREWEIDLTDKTVMITGA